MRVACPGRPHRYLRAVVLDVVVRPCAGKTVVQQLEMFRTVYGTAAHIDHLARRAHIFNVAQCEAMTLFFQLTRYVRASLGNPEKIDLNLELRRREIGQQSVEQPPALLIIEFEIVIVVAELQSVILGNP